MNYFILCSLAENTFLRSEKPTYLILSMTKVQETKSFKNVYKQTLQFFGLCFKLPLFIMLFNDSWFVTK